MMTEDFEKWKENHQKSKKIKRKKTIKKVFKKTIKKTIKKINKNCRVLGGGKTNLAPSGSSQLLRKGVVPLMEEMPS